MNKSTLQIAAAAIFVTSGLAYSATELAKIGNKSISLEAFNQKYQENIKFFPMKPPSKESVLDDLIKRELAIQEAHKLGLDKDPDVMERMDTVLYQALLEKRLSKEFEKIVVSDDDAETYYKKYPEIRTSHVFIEVLPGAPKDADKKAYEKIKQINDNYLHSGKMSFAEVAQKYSEGVAAPMGGDIDYQTRDRLDPIYYDTAVKLREPGKISGIIRSRFGYHIIKLTGVHSWKEVDRAKIKRLSFEEKRQQIFESYMRELRKNAKVQINTALIKD